LVKSLVSKAISTIIQGAMVDSLVRSIWQNIAPPKFEFMVWLALLGKLNTKDMLVRKRMLREESNYCTFCMHTRKILIMCWSLALSRGGFGSKLLMTKAKTL